MLGQLALWGSLLLWCTGTASGYTGSDDRFVKKYAMMKVYESCFGPEVVREVRQEMRAASAKCQSQERAGLGPHGGGLHGLHGAAHGGPGPGFGFAPSLDRLDRPQPPQQQQPQQVHRPHGKPQQVDSSRLQQALMAALNRQAQGGSFSAYRPVTAAPPPAPAPAAAPGFSSAPGYSSAPSGLSELLSQYQPPASAAPAAPAPGPGVYQAMPQVDPLQALQALQVLQQYQSRGNYHHHQYQQPQQQPQQQQPYYSQPFSGRYSRSSRVSKAAKLDPESEAKAPPSSSRSSTSARSSSRTSRDLDVQGQLETLTSRMTGRVRNVTCVMQELGYLDSALEPDFERIAARISRLPVTSELRRDMLEGVQFCRQFSQCIPDSRRDRFMLSGELLRPMFFFRCYKHKKLEACIMKDVRERYHQAAVDDNLLPNTRAMDLDAAAAAADGGEARAEAGDGLDEDHMAAAVYEFLYGGDNLDADPFF